MKNKIIYVFTCLLFFATTACKEEFLEIIPEDQPTLDGFYTNTADIRAATATLYGRPWFGYNDKFGWAAGDGMAGDLFNDYQDEGQLFYFSFSSNNGIVLQAWQSLYNVVSFSNAIINDMPPVAARNGVSQENINRGLAEARFVRAMAYFKLVEFWGEVPILENVAALIAENNYNVPKHTVASVYEFIRRDLEFAATHLPASDTPGRVTQWSAKGLLAKLHVTMGQRFKSEADFGKARDYAADVINNSGLSLMPNYEDLFKIENNNNQETLFALQWIAAGWGVGNSRQAVFARNGRITNNSEAWGGGKSVTKSFMDNVTLNAEGGVDQRRKSIFMQLGDHYPEIRKSQGGYTYNIVTPDPDGGGNLDNPSPILNNIKKYVVGSFEDVGVPVNNQSVPLNLYMLRLADVYLIHAEAILGSAESTSDAAALLSFNTVRARAGLEPRESLTFRQIFNERRVEFGIEGINWLDVKRFVYRNEAEAIEYLNSQNRAFVYGRLEEDGEGVGDPNTWEGYEIIENTFKVLKSQNELILPIPSAEVTQNPLFAPSEEPVEYSFE